MDKKQKVDLLRTLQENIEPLDYPYNAEEKSILRRILSEEEWYLLSDDEKQSRRRSSISIGKKWALDDNINIDYSYQEGVVIIYDVIREILKKLDDSKGLNTDLLRIKAMLIIEKDFINESSRSKKHLPPEFFENLADTLSEKYPELKLNKFYELYFYMYKKWPNKPKPINEN